MHIVILDGLDDDRFGHDYQYQKLVRHLSAVGHSPNRYNLVDLNPAPCCGCEHCRSVTPGACVHDDMIKELLGAVCRAELVVVLSPIVVGGLSSKVKRVIDRMMPLLTPYHRMVAGETHLRPRQKHFSFMVVVGSGGSPEERKLFTSLAERNALNLACNGCAVCFLPGDDVCSVIEQAIASMMERTT